MLNDELVERVARAIQGAYFPASYPAPVSFEDDTEAMRDWCRHLARAALTAAGVDEMRAATIEQCAAVVEERGRISSLDARPNARDTAASPCGHASDAYHARHGRWCRGHSSGGVLRRPAPFRDSHRSGPNCERRFAAGAVGFQQEDIMDWIILALFAFLAGLVGWGLGARWARQRLMRFDEHTGRFG